MQETWSPPRPASVRFRILHSGTSFVATDPATAPSGESLIDGPYAWLRLGSSVALGTMGSVGFWGVVVILPAVQSEFGVDRGDASIPYTLTMIGFAAGNVLFGRYVDRLGIVIPLIAAAFATAIGYAGAAAATNIWLFALLQGFFVGIGTAASFGPLIADVSHWFRRRRGVAVALCACGNYIGGTFWPLVITWLMAGYGWRTTYVIIAVVIVVTMVPLSLTLRREPPKEDPDATAAALSAAGLAHTERKQIGLSMMALMVLLSIAGVACCVAMSMPQVHIVAYCADLGYGAARGAEMLSLMLAAGAITRIFSGFIADYIGGVRTLLIGSVLQGIALVFYLPFDGLMSLYVISLMFGLAQGGIVPSYAIIVREYMPARVAAERVGILIMMTIVGMAFGGWSSGWIYDATGSYQAAFIHGIGWNILNVGIMLIILLRTRGDRSATPAAT
ncbi:MAG: MFS transporter [Rhodospirillaceae bacterium]|nr:MFS transporter [Rhodospirillaceae bacterium]